MCWMKAAVTLACSMAMVGCGAAVTPLEQTPVNESSPQAGQAVPAAASTRTEAQADRVSPATEESVPSAVSVQEPTEVSPGSFVRQSGNPRERRRNIQQAERRLNEINLAMQNLRLALDAGSSLQSSEGRIRQAYERLKRLSENPDGSSFEGQLDQLRELHDVHQSHYRQERGELQQQLSAAARWKPQREFLRGILGEGPIPATDVRLPAGPGESAPLPRDYELDELVGRVRAITSQLSRLTSASGVQAWSSQHRSLPDFRNHFAQRARQIRQRLDSTWDAEAGRRAFTVFDTEMARFDAQVERISRLPGSDVAMGRKPSAASNPLANAGPQPEPPERASASPIRPVTPDLAPISAEARRLMDSYGETIQLAVEMADTLRGLQAGADASEVGRRLRGQVERYVKHGESMTRLYLQLDATERDRAVAAAARRLQDLPGKPSLKGGDILTVMVEAAKGPAGPAIRDDLQFARDRLLGTRGLHMPVNFRKRITEALGPAGSPLRVR